MKSAISVRDSFQGKQVMIAGASGFIGKVFLSMALDYLPEIEKLIVLIRPKKGISGWQRFEAMVNKSYGFQNLHERHGFGLRRFLSEKVEVVEGDVSLPRMGLDENTHASLLGRVDLIVNSTGLVDFFPDLRDALSVNIEGALHVAAFASECKNARLLHLSTCYVVGRRNGLIPEQLAGFQTPKGQSLNPEEELSWIQDQIEITERQATKQSESLLQQKRWARQTFADLGKARSEKLGWTNTYTYSKALAEGLIKTKFPKLKFASFRPAIVESAVSYPFPGWNEGFNTCGPLAFLLGSWFRYLPTKPGTPFDIIPVDLVCKGMLVASAQLLSDMHAEVYHCGSSDKNTLTIDEAVEYVTESYRMYYKRKGKSFAERKLRSFWKVKNVGNRVYPFSNKSLLEFFEMLLKLTHKINLRQRWFKHLTQNIEKTLRKLSKVEGLLKLFKPFMHDHYIIFESQNLFKNPVIEKEFEYSPQGLDWKKYWLDVHMPGLRRWSFPKFTREEVAHYQPRKEIRLGDINQAARATPKRS